ncbi:OmpA family protein [Limimaricola hongkongensis]|uniref:Putative outer membrane lipoprotein n=1 Tax=Limimaricola hongkongensis DSM 17492 TaxID=1122180 RepID=A0A017HG55_9RHOB|nr:OmpA family protein [Limimaricola hongkongensis]EYD73341.1 Putative outer membrane lipoprotein [Limimaricola hongkongensis DSM 17492]
MKGRLFLAALSAGLAPGPALPQELPVPAGAELVVETTRETGTYDLPTGPARNGPPPVIRQEGEVRLRGWRIESGTDPSRIVAPIRAALEQAGFGIVLDCTARACGGFDFRFGIEVLPPPEMHVDLGRFHALSARRSPGRDGPAAVGVLASRTGTTAHLQIVTVTPDGARAAPTIVPPPTVPAATGDIADLLERDGHAVLDGLDFAPGRAALGGRDIPALDALARWLDADPNRRLVLVGHTDMTGALDANIALSRRRAQAVRQRLLDTGIAPDRLGAEGAGWLAPRASNADAAGRAANRRVEAVVSGG